MLYYISEISFEINIQWKYQAIALTKDSSANYPKFD